ncbi:MAG: peptidoglycan DD-metalloendopeptidase family protein [Tepidiformaceae bacterium]
MTPDQRNAASAHLDVIDRLLSELEGELADRRAPAPALPDSPIVTGASVVPEETPIAGSGRIATWTRSTVSVATAAVVAVAALGLFSTLAIAGDSPQPEASGHALYAPVDAPLVFEGAPRFERAAPGGLFGSSATVAQAVATSSPTEAAAVAGSYNGGRFTNPLRGRYLVTDAWGFARAGGAHNGIDLAPTGSSRIAVYSACAGVVTRAGYDGSYGEHIIVDCGDGWSTLYGHLSAIHVSSGAWVDSETVIGRTGSTGFSTGEHLHFEIRRLDVALDPSQFLPFGPGTYIAGSDGPFPADGAGTGGGTPAAREEAIAGGEPTVASTPAVSPTPSDPTETMEPAATETPIAVAPIAEPEADAPTAPIDTPAPGSDESTSIAESGTGPASVPAAE